ncbi:NUDIX domain-containing protein [Candidatus Dojkabacteria bacterium]|nr:NUDIX domain-containing protein [Candidatus Dojkabacteria bacterium]
MKPLHYIQMGILRNLLFSDGLRYSEMKPGEDLENNQFDFHLKELMKQGLIKKNDKLYQLTDKGKEYANTMDTDKIKVQKQAKIGAISVALRKIDGEWEYLVYTRLKQPFYGSQGFPSGKVQWGELCKDASKREFNEETSLDGEPELYRIGHHLVFNKNSGELVEDKIFFFHRIINPEGELKSNEEGKFEWVKEKDLRKYLKKPFETAEVIISEALGAKNFDGVVGFYERIEHTDNF